MIGVKVKDDMQKLNKYLKRISDTRQVMHILEECGERGVEALRVSTPIDSGETSQSWSYEITEDSNGYVINFNNSHVNNGVNIAIILQHGHGTRNGGYVQGRDYINPALKPVFDEMVNELAKEVSRL